MNRDLSIPDGEAWVVDRYTPDSRPARPAAAVPESPGLDFATLVRIISNWRWLIVGAAALGLLGAIIVTLLTTPVYRSKVTLEVNPPTVEIMDEQSREQAASPVSSWDYVATQVGLLSSRSIAERAAQ
ncbi:MAG TPA: Wzz/FepE/Etk N-terminal domain-containing protein, partial [Sphingomicrobium sp.]|nr:Wzz/FepE/Etk N-terminal domain-containing protein [Sphingomicrobium sp.]